MIDRRLDELGILHWLVVSRRGSLTAEVPMKKNRCLLVKRCVQGGIGLIAAGLWHPGSLIADEQQTAPLAPARFRASVGEASAIQEPSSGGGRETAGGGNSESVAIERLENNFMSRIFKVPRNFMELANADAFDPGAVEDPFGDDDSPTILGRMRALNPRNVFVAVGVPFPEGTSVTLDAEAGQLVCRNAPDNLDLIQIYVESMWERVPSRIQLRAEIYSLPKPLALDLLVEADRESNLGERLRGLERDGSAELVDVLSIATLDGATAVVSCGSELDYVSSYMVQDGKDTAVMNSIFLGSRMEVRAAIEKHGAGLLVDVALEKTFGEPDAEESVVLGPISGKELPVMRVLVDQASIRTRARLLGGEVRLLGTLSPDGGASESSCLVLLKASLEKIGR
ncbi:MAG: hypothetical protein ACR2RV_01045 [Verrucomicrobiales bacterium]